MQQRNLLKGVIVGGVISAILLLIAIWWLFFRMNFLVYEVDTVIEGDLVTSQPILLKNNAKLTVNGNAFLDEEVHCDAGALNLEINGSLLGESKLKCDSDPEELGAESSGINLVVRDNLIMSADSEIISQGSFQLVDDASKLAKSQEGVDKLFDSLTDPSTGLQVGPLTDDSADISASTIALSDKSNFKLPFVQVANAQEELSAEEEAELEQLKLDLAGLQEFFDSLDAMAEKRKKEALEERVNKSLNELFEGIEEVTKLIQDHEEAQINNDELRQNEADYIGTLGPKEVDELKEILIHLIKNREANKKSIIISGKITIGNGGKPPYVIDAEGILEKDGKRKKPKKIVLNFDFSDKKGVLLGSLFIIGPGAVSADTQTNAACNTTADNGGDAMRFNGRAGSITIQNFTLAMGAGGDGGSVTTNSTCKTATATAGNGGKPGNFRIKADNNFQINGFFRIIPGQGGAGGDAVAVVVPGEVACPGKPGGDATATGGNGGDSKQRLKASGTIGGLSNIEIDPAIGGNAGHAVAEAGDGGDGQACKCAGGNGGIGTSTGGKGGDAALSDSGLSQGGDGGDAASTSGNGGFGGSCKSNVAFGGAGGNGGNSFATEGKPGNGDIVGLSGLPGDNSGDGGNGGSGCGEGTGGSKGVPTGVDGIDGKNTCKNPPPEEETIIGFLAGADPDSEYEVEAIEYKGSYIPIFLIHKSDPDKCSEKHWHGGPAKMLNGETATDPNQDGCGFGELSKKPVIKVPVDATKFEGLYGAGSQSYLLMRDLGGEDEGVEMIQIDPPVVVIPAF